MGDGLSPQHSVLSPVLSARLPKRTDIRSILIIGSGPIVIGQACEVDYSGTQACKALRDEGYRIILVNSNLATALSDAGVLEKYGVELIGASSEAIKTAEDRQLFKECMTRIGVKVPRSGYVGTVDDAEQLGAGIGYPLVVRPSFTLGGSGGGIAYNVEELRAVTARGLELSPVHRVLVEESVLGWKEFGLEVMRDKADNVIVVCSIENFDPMGVHTGDSITVAPQQTLTNVEYQAMRDEAKRIIRAIGV